jgi:hypothetical protein
MDWLKKLAGLLKTNVNLPQLKEVHLFSDIGNKKVTIVDRRTLKLNIARLDESGVEALQKVLRSHQEKGGLVIESTSLERLEEFNHTASEASTKRFLDLFKGKIPSYDLEILRYAAYLKVVFDRGESVFELKKQIVEKFGERGRNICNLYSAGYFESQIGPLYELMFAQDDFSPEKFNQIYEMIVTDSPFAVFVSRGMTEEQLFDEVKHKIETNRKYGVVNLNLHGIGEDNASKINTLLPKLQSEKLIGSILEVVRDKKVLSVKLKISHNDEVKGLLGGADEVLA